MIEAISGKLTAKLPHKIIVELSGISYSILVSFHTSSKLPQVGNEVSVFCHLNWREEGPQLFGFESETERQFFRLLTKVNKVGPKLAMTIISSDTTENLASMILSEDAKRLTSLKGVGPKLASRLIVELKDPIAKLGLGPAESNMTYVKTPEGALPFENDVIEALENLGYTSKEINKAIKKIIPDVNKDTSIEEIIERILRSFSNS